jgi:serpin B
VRRRPEGRAVGDARERINAWVSDHTGARIAKLLPRGALSSLTRLVIVNALHFVADWATPFGPDATSTQPFAIDGGAARPVPMMHGIAGLGHAHLDGLTLVELPHVGGERAMVIELPYAVDGVAAVELALTPDVLTQSLDALAPRQVALALPRFKISRLRRSSCRACSPALACPMRSTTRSQTSR